MFYRGLVERHFELVEVEPAAGVGVGQIVVVIPRGEAERVKLALRRQQQNRRRFLADDSRIAAFPLAHPVNARPHTAALGR